MKRKTNKKPAADAKRRIVAFCCENSGHKAAQPILAAVRRRGVVLVKVPCAGRVEVGELLRCLADGADAAIVVGCPMDSCRYVNGSKWAAKRVAVARLALRDAGLEENRIKMCFLSSVDTPRLKNIIEEMTAK